MLLQAFAQIRDRLREDKRQVKDGSRIAALAARHAVEHVAPRGRNWLAGRGAGLRAGGIGDRRQGRLRHGEIAGGVGRDVLKQRPKFGVPGRSVVAGAGRGGRRGARVLSRIT